MKGTWAIEQGSRRTGVVMKVDAHDQIYPRTRTVTEDFGRRLQPNSRGRTALKRSEQRLGKAFPIEGFGRMAPRRSLKTGISNFSSHSGASDDGKGVSNLWLRGYSSDKESIWQFKTTRTTRTVSERQPAYISARRERSTLFTEQTNRQRGSSFLAGRGKSGEANHRPTQASAKRGLHLPLCFEVSTTRLDTEPLDFSSGPEGSLRSNCALRML